MIDLGWRTMEKSESCWWRNGTVLARAEGGGGGASVGIHNDTDIYIYILRCDRREGEIRGENERRREGGESARSDL